MGAVDLGAGGGRRSKKGSGIKKPKRLGFSLDMTPLVDVAFLLLTFFMFATTMAQPRMMRMTVPPDMDTPVKMKQSELLNVFINDDGKVLYGMGADTTYRPIEMEKLRAFSVQRNTEKGNDLVTVLKVHPEASYESMVKVLDELNRAEGDLITAYTKNNVNGGKRERKFSIQPLEEVELERLKQL